jgi:hypothetical protein
MQQIMTAVSAQETSFHAPNPYETGRPGTPRRVRG